MKMSKQEFSQYFGLIAKAPWLISNSQLYQDSGSGLFELFELCGNDTNKNELVTSLIERLCYLSSENWNEYLYKIAKYIIEDLQFTPSETQITPLSNASEVKSGNRLLRDISVIPILRSFVCEKCFVDSFSLYKNNLKNGRNNIILVDDFIGTGRSFIKKIKVILSKNSEEKINIFCCAAVGMDFGIKQIEDEGCSVFCPKILSKGISDNYSGEDLTQALKDMQEIEKKLASEIYDSKSGETKLLSTFSLGYKQSEALVSFRGISGNTPNNVFPIFWWEKKKDGGNREVLCPRTGV